VDFTEIGQLGTMKNLGDNWYFM